jgi:hypothetical protein
MNRQERSGVGFGFGLILIWLIALTAFVMYGKMVEEVKADTIIMPPQLEVIEIEGVDYEI